MGGREDIYSQSTQHGWDFIVFHIDPSTGFTDSLQYPNGRFTVTHVFQDNRDRFKRNCFFHCEAGNITFLFENTCHLYIGPGMINIQCFMQRHMRIPNPGQKIRNRICYWHFLSVSLITHQFKSTEAPGFSHGLLGSPLPTCFRYTWNLTPESQLTKTNATKLKFFQITPWSSASPAP